MSDHVRRLGVLGALLWLAAPLEAAPEPDAGKAATDAKPKVIVVPMRGGLYYSASVAEVDKIVRGTTVQRPAALVLLFSSPGGSRQVAFDIASRLADLPDVPVVGFVSGEHGGVFGPGAFCLMACDRLFIAPENVIEPVPVVTPPKGLNWREGPTLTPQQFGQVQQLTQQGQLSWDQVRGWLDAYGLLPTAGAATTRPLDEARLRRAPATQPGHTVLRAEPAADLEDVLQQLGLADARLLNWPDPVDRPAAPMRQVMQAVEEHTRQMNAALEAAHSNDPRAAKYPLRDLQREYSVGAFIPEGDWDVAYEFRQSDTVVYKDVFEDGGLAWRINTDRCIAYVRQAIASNRRLATLAARYPELNVDLQALNDMHAQLNEWLGQLRAERGAVRPPQ